MTAHNHYYIAAKQYGSQVISSPHNAAIKRIRALRNRKERQRSGVFFVEGIRHVIELARQPAEIETLVVAPELLRSASARSLIEAQQASGVACLRVTGEVFQTLSQKEGPQGIGAIVRQRWSALPDISPAGARCWVALEGVQDPGNLGAILRTSDAVGGAGIILLGKTTDPYDPAAVRASMGAIFTQQLVRAEPPEFASWVRRQRVAVIGAAGDARLDYRTVAYPAPLVLLMGSERQGLSPAHQALCSQLVRIPMVGRSDSLNLAVATSVLLYELFYQHQHRLR